MPGASTVPRTLEPAQPVRRPHTAADIYRTQAIAFQRFRMIGRPDPRAPRLLRFILGGALAVGSLVLVVSQLTYRERAEARVIAMGPNRAHLQLASAAPELRLPMRLVEVRTQAGAHFRLHDPALVVGRDGRELRGRLERTGSTDSPALAAGTRVTVTGGTWPIWK